MKRKLSVYIAICLVLVFVSPAAAADVNLALGKPVQQSSTGYGGDPRRAVDGNTDGNYGANSVSHTDNQAQSWWQVDLGAVQGIRNIRIWNRTDCCGERLAKFYVLVSEAPFSSGDLNTVLRQPGVGSFLHDGVAGRTTDIAVNRNARYVRVQLSATNYLHLAEVEVFGGGGTYLLPMSPRSQAPLPWSPARKPEGPTPAPFRDPFRARLISPGGGEEMTEGLISCAR